MPASIAYYYFDYKDVSKRDVRGLLASLLFQLGDDSDRCWDALHGLYKMCRDGSDQPSDAHLAKCLETMVKQPGQGPIFVIIDALDECPSTTGTPSAREEVLDFVEDLVGSKHANLFICITSRPEQDIQTVLNPLTSASCRVSLHEEGGQSEDINSYVRSFVETDRKMRRWKEEDRELVIATLSERAGGMFRWVFCQLDTLRRCMPSSIRKALEELPTTLDDTYERMLQGIPKEQKQHAHHLFQCLVAASRPLRVEELAEIFAIEFDTNTGPNLMENWRPEDPEEAVLSACSTLIAIIDNRGSKIVQFSHFSVKEFLTSDRLRTSEFGNIRHYFIPFDAAHGILVRACIIVLLQLDENVDKERLAEFPLAFYAAEHWVDHAKRGDVATAASWVQDGMEQLLDASKPYFAAWACWIFDAERGRVRRSISDLPKHPPPPEGTVLYYAALYGFSWLAKHLIARMEDTNAKCGHHGSPLHAAVYMGHVDAARVLLDHGADVDMGNQSGKPPLVTAYKLRNLEAMGLLLEHGANPDVRYDGSGPISHNAAFTNNVEVMELLLQHKADMHLRSTTSKWTLLHWVSSAELAQFLLDHGADINAQDANHSTPLHEAAEDGRLEVVRVLLKHGADVHIRGRGDRTPFQVAKSRGRTQIAHLLLEHGAEDE
ncbi:ankyrin repeat-containing domain protein [Russula brevipes]|nr:ankyrin repeat-containing domain protein [Russula brevipes]